jgi:hypothetical protein
MTRPSIYNRGREASQSSDYFFVKVLPLYVPVYDFFLSPTRVAPNYICVYTNQYIHIYVDASSRPRYTYMVYKK